MGRPEKLEPMQGSDLQLHMDAKLLTYISYQIKSAKIQYHTFNRLFKVLRHEK
jgi:hypothetical protein